MLKKGTLKAETIEFACTKPCALVIKLEKRLRIIFVLIVIDICISLLQGTDPAILIQSLLKLVQAGIIFPFLRHIG